MNRLTRLGALAVLSGALVALAPPPAAQAQPDKKQPHQDAVAIPGGGTDLFRALLAREQVRPVTTNELRNMWAVNDDLIVIAIGSMNQRDWAVDPTAWVRQAVSANGAALLASDSPVPLESGWGGQVGRFAGNFVSANRDDCLHQFDDCPYAVPISPNERLKGNRKPGRVWDLFRGVNKLATNQPTYIEMNEDDFRNEFQYPLARLPKSSFVANWRRFDRPPLFAVGGDGQNQWNGRPGYSFLAVADSSVFINQMIMEQDTDNLEFTLRTIEYLQGPSKHRKRCAFIENGRVVEKFDTLQEAMNREKSKIPPEKVPNLGPLIEKNQEKLVELGNRLVDQIQSKDGLHNWLVGREGTPEERRKFGEWVEALAVILAVFASLFLLRRTLRARHPTDVPPAPAMGGGAAPTGPPGVFERRQKELVRRNNLYEPVRNLMREFFDSAGAPPEPGPRMPRLVIDHRAVRKPDSLRQALRDMWRIAYGPPTYLSAQRWFELEPYFERLCRAHADGKWRFEAGEEGE